MVTSEPTRRARRYAMVSPVLFREQGEAAWRQASTVNISHSGVLFRADGPLPGTGHAVDIIVTLPIKGLAPGPQVRCTGQVVRIAREAFAGEGCGVAVTIVGYALEGRCAS